MAVNKDAAKGFVPIRHTNGSPWNGVTTAYLVPSGDATALFIGDPVKHGSSSGAAGVYVGGMNCEGMPTAIRDESGTTGQSFVGVVTGFSFDPTNLTKKHRAASENRIAFVCTDPTVIYEVQEDAASIGLATAIITTAGSTTTGVSGMMLDSSAVATTSTLPVKILGLVQRPDNTLSTGTTDKAKFEVIFNTGWYATNSVGT
jgi:hypothetical protein